jgi:hypothetical protein
MKKPIHLLQDRLLEITESLRDALNNELDAESINQLANHYNSYYVALQLLDLHTEIDYYFDTLHITPKGNISYFKEKIKNN